MKSTPDQLEGEHDSVAEPRRQGRRHARGWKVHPGRSSHRHRFTR
jgi:hypothetical protein